MSYIGFKFDIFGDTLFVGDKVVVLPKKQKATIIKENRKTVRIKFDDTSFEQNISCSNLQRV